MLNERRRRFVAAYARLANATKAAIEAGYSQKTAKQIGERLLSFVDVKNAIAELTKEHQSKTIASAIERQQFWTSIMRAEGEFSGSELKDRIKAAELLGKTQGDFIERVEQVNFNFDDLQNMTDEELEALAKRVGFGGSPHSD